MLHSQSAQWLGKEKGNEIWKNWCPKRGEIYLVNLGENEGSILNGIRPAVVVSNNMNNKHSTVIHVSPLTSSQTKTDIPVHVKLDNSNGLKFDSICCIEQTKVVCKSAVIINGSIIKITQLSEKRMKEINLAIKIQFGLG